MLLALTPALAAASPLDLYQQRQVYRQALDHLTAGRNADFRHAREALDEYVLAPYLDYYQVKTRLSSVTDDQMREFQTRHGELPAAGILHYRWLKHLGARRQWHRLLSNYQPTTDAELRCYHLRALWANDRREEALDGVAEVWTVGYSQPEACDPIFELWMGAGRLTAELAWERLQLALDAGERRLGRYLLRFFEAPLENWANALYQVHLQPEQLSGAGTYANDSPYARAVIAHGVKRLAARDPQAAATVWQRYQDTHAFSASDAQTLTETILLAQARTGTFPPHRLKGLSAAFAEGMADAAVRTQRWQDAVYYIEQMPLDQKSDLRWQYWLARSLTESQLGSERARLTFEALAGERNYYGFLAAHRLGRETRLNAAPPRADSDQLNALQNIPAVGRALELYAVGDVLNARREWFALLPRLSPTEQYHAALLAQDVGWIAQSIFMANAADLRDNLELRFPVAYADEFQRISHSTTVPQPFLMAVARQESAFDPAARSRANARGLMQLMHPTANLVADRLGVSQPSVTELYDPGVNISLGGHHLARLLNRYGNRRPLAAAAYNAGEHRVDRWVRERDGMPMDVWIETIPFRETRDYVKNVLAFTQVYGRLLGSPGPVLESNETAIN